MQKVHNLFFIFYICVVSILFYFCILFGFYQKVKENSVSWFMRAYSKICANIQSTLDNFWRFCFIHRWCHDIGREQAANKPLLKTVFQVVFSHGFTCGWVFKSWVFTLWYFLYLQVMMRLFSPRKTTLLFVIRDKTKV